MMLENINSNNKTLYHYVILQHVNNISILLTLNPLRLTLGVGVSKYIKTYKRPSFPPSKTPRNTYKTVFVSTLLQTTRIIIYQKRIFHA